MFSPKCLTKFLRILNSVLDASRWHAEYVDTYIYYILYLSLVLQTCLKQNIVNIPLFFLLILKIWCYLWRNLEFQFLIDDLLQRILHCHSSWLWIQKNEWVFSISLSSLIQHMILDMGNYSFYLTFQRWHLIDLDAGNFVIDTPQKLKQKLEMVIFFFLILCLICEYSSSDNFQELDI